MGKEERKQGTSHWNSVTIPERVRERAYERWESDGDCWISTYSVASHGYAQIGWNNKPERHVVLAHRAAWEHVNGPVPRGMTIDHLCKQRRCVNPGHLRILDNYENARRTQGRDWPLGECANGHSNEHLSTYADGRRHCSICVDTVWKATPRLASVTPREPKQQVEKAPRKRRMSSTHCLRGHELTPENTYTKPNTHYTQCRTCKADLAREWHSKNREAA